MQLDADVVSVVLPLLSMVPSAVICSKSLGIPRADILVLALATRLFHTARPDAQAYFASNLDPRELPS